MSKKILRHYLSLFVTAMAVSLFVFLFIVLHFRQEGQEFNQYSRCKPIRANVLKNLFFDQNDHEMLSLPSDFASSCFIKAEHLRPDELRDGRYLVMNQEVRFVPFDKQFYCKSNGDCLLFSDEVQKLKGKISINKGHVIANIYSQIENQDKLIDSVRLRIKKSQVSTRLADVVKKVQDAKMFHEDCLFNKYGGSIFKDRKNRLRLLIDEKMVFLDESMTLGYQDKRFKVSPNIKNCIALHVKPHANGAKISLFSENGHECVQIDKSFEPIKPFFNTTFFKDMQVIHSEMIKCKIFNKRVTLEKGDWFFIHENKKIHPLKNFDDIQRCINSLLPGSLVIIDQIQKTNNNDFVIFGHFFDKTRQSMGIIRQIVKI